MSSFHPPAGQIFWLWETFLKNVNPLVKVIHAPTVQHQLLQASVDQQNVSEAFEALMFAIYASAVTSINNKECLEVMDIPRSQILERYHRLTQEALNRTRLFETPDVVALQAAVLFIHTVRQCSLSIT
jgi:hypothetical protein